MPTKKLSVVLLNEAALPAPDQADFERWLTAVSTHQPCSGELCIKIIDADESQTLNRTYRHRDKATNVLSFHPDLPDFIDDSLLGDLAMCQPVVQTEALQQGKAVQDHWAHLTVHGVLHLLGHDHASDAQAAVMEALEVRILDTLGIDDPYRADENNA